MHWSFSGHENLGGDREEGEMVVKILVFGTFCRMYITYIEISLYLRPRLQCKLEPFFAAKKPRLSDLHSKWHEKCVGKLVQV